MNATNLNLHPDYGYNGGYVYNFVNGSQPKVNVAFHYGSDPGPYPIPYNVAIEGGAQATNTGDRHAIIIDTTNCVDYELFALWQNSDGSWRAGSGAIFPLTSDKLRPNGWTSADAAGLAILPGLVRYDEVQSGHINHALRVTADRTRDTWIWPARHEASPLTGSQYPAMGQRFRLKQSFDISGFPQRVQVILQALKTYGMILADNGTSWHLSGLLDPRWDDNEMHQLTQVLGYNFEAISESGIMEDLNSGQTASEVVSVPTGWVNLVSKNSGKCLDVSGGPLAILEGVHLQQWTCVGGINQEFQFVPVSGGYKINIRSSGLQLDICGGPSAIANGIHLQQWPFLGYSNEIFNVRPTSDGYFTVVPTNSGSCLDVSAASTLDGATVQQWTCLGVDNQKWRFSPAS